MEEEGEQSAMNGNHYRNNRNYSKFKERIPILSGACLVLIIFLLISILLLSILRSEKPEPIKLTCMKCSILTTVIDRWAWKDVVEDDSGDECCFTTENGWIKTLKYYVDKRLSAHHDDMVRLQSEFNHLENFVYSDLSKTPNRTYVPLPDFSALEDLINKILNRRTAVLHLISDRINIPEDMTEPTIHWDQEVNQGNISLEKDNGSIQIGNSALYYLSVQVKFRVNVPSNQTRNTTVQFYVAKRKAGHLSRVDDYKKRYVFHAKMAEHDAVLHTITRLDRGDRLIIRFPTSQKTYLAVEPGSHRISIFELS